MRPRIRLTSKQSKSYSERKTARRATIVALIVFCLFLYTFCFSRISQLNFLAINEIVVNGADSDIRQDLVSAAYKSVEGRYAGLFSRSNVFIYPKSSVENAVKNASVRVERVEISMDRGNNLVVGVKEKDPAALVCAGLPDFSDEQENCYFADQNGKLFKEAPVFSANVFRKYFIPGLSHIIDEDGSLVGTFMASTTSFVELQEFYDDVRAAGLEVQAILVNEKGEYELYVNNPSTSTLSATSSDAKMAVVYFNNSRSLKEQSMNLISFWKKMTEKARANGERLDFEYIDVRYGSNVFYRLIK